MVNKFKVIKGDNYDVSLIDLMEDKELMFIRFDNQEDADNMYACLDYYVNFINGIISENEVMKRDIEKLRRFITKLELERCQYLNDKQAKSKWGENYD